MLKLPLTCDVLVYGIKFIEMPHLTNLEFMMKQT